MVLLTLREKGKGLVSKASIVRASVSYLFQKTETEGNVETMEIVPYRPMQSFSQVQSSTIGANEAPWYVPTA